MMSEAFERAYRARRTFNRRKASEKTWLYAIAVNCVRDHARRQSVENRAMEQVAAGSIVGARAAADLEDALSDKEALRAGLATLSEDEREAIALRFGADLTVPEMAT